MTNFTFDTGIPNAPNNPSSDQPKMKVNNQSTSGLIAVDHVGFNANNGGQHLQVTFNSNNVPVVPTSPPVLFTQPGKGAGSGLPQLFFYSGDNAHSASQYFSSGVNGSTMLMGGIIMKWGQNATGGTGLASITFASMTIGDFPNSCFGVWAYILNETNPNTADSAIYTNSYSTSGFNVVTTFRRSLGPIAASFGFVALGN